MGNEYPEGFSRFYDTIYHQIRDSVDTAFFLNAIKKSKGKVLEVGVGTGRMLGEALAAGADIYGIDISPNMLSVLKRKLPENQTSRVTLQNIIDFRFDSKFDLIIAPFRVIMHIQDKDDQLNAINNVYNHLNNGGTFIFDTFIPDLKALISGLNNVVDFDGEYEPGKKLKRTVTTNPDKLNQLININFKLEWDEAGILKTEEWQFPLRYFFRYELEHLVERSQFTDYEIIGDYNGNPLDEQSKDFIVVCKKSKSKLGKSYKDIILFYCKIIIN